MYSSTDARLEFAAFATLTPIAVPCFPSLPELALGFAARRDRLWPQIVH